VYEQKYEAALAELDPDSGPVASSAGGAAVGGGSGSAASAALNAEHAEITKLFSQLCFSLDSLSNFHFTPKPVAPAPVVSAQHAPALNMEEVTPLGTARCATAVRCFATSSHQPTHVCCACAGVSASQSVAPREVFKSKEAGAPRAASEMSREEKRRARAARRTKQSKKKKSIEAEHTARDKQAAAEGKSESPLTLRSLSRSFCACFQYAFAHAVVCPVCSEQIRRSEEGKCCHSRCQERHDRPGISLRRRHALQQIHQLLHRHARP
jgi:hypothetical protein